ncbi:hypothetical protein, partial [Aeromonas veronii]|uniref:hypothetical protein n=1 Tax=Aeromonas veronii TaxID=654 RepID=UPI001CA59368
QGETPVKGSIRSQLDLLVNHTPLVQEMFAISPCPNTISSTFAGAHKNSEWRVLISSISTAIGSFIDYFQPLPWALFWPPLRDDLSIKGRVKRAVITVLKPVCAMRCGQNDELTPCLCA